MRDERQQAVTNMETQQACRSFPIPYNSAILPRESFMPEEIVQNYHLNRDRRGRDSRQTKALHKDFEKNDLQGCAYYPRQAKSTEPRTPPSHRGHRGVSVR